MASVVLDHVSKEYPGGVMAVRDACLDIADREFVALVGPSGCGKSTTLRMIAGLEEATAGDIRIDDRRVNDVPPRDRDLAMVFQNYALYPHMSVAENLAFGLRLRRVPRDEIHRRVAETAALLGIDGLLGRRPRALSGGQRQRVALGRAIVRRPRAFLFDEPLSNLDARMRVQMRVELSRLHRRLDATMIYVTHDQVEAMTMGDRIVVMKDGAIHQVGPPLEIYDRPADRFVAGFIGSPPMNFVEGRLVGREGGLWFEAPGVALRLPPPVAERIGVARAGVAVTFGVRPEALQIREARPIPGQGIDAMVDVVEALGADTLVHATAGPHRLVARSPERIPGGARPVVLEPDAARWHFFDSETGRLLG
ncbi:MAG: sn-glycerol-3-phosphate ABC transporter ATP-binding protein UgpC [Verrucomicrobia bacterium]|nr:sn-glycerol-3-phosphate ABC transporter ATP-binding protein UgpC [Verrucomicrobiota bacterium]